MPDVPTLRRLLQSVATLDAIIEREWQYRYYSYNSRWATNQEMGSMRNGSGDHWFALFLPVGAGIVGLAHEAPMFRPGEPPAGIFSGLPPELDELRSEPAFDTKHSTFCLWCMGSGSAWQRGDVTFPPSTDPDGSAELLHILDGEPASYARFAGEYFETQVPLEAIAAIYDHTPLTAQLVAQLNPQLTLHDIEADVAEIGYPRAAG